MMLAAATPARAAEWFVSGTAGQEVSYDDNIGLRGPSDEQVSAFGETTSVGVTVGGRSPVLDLRLDSLFNFTRFPSESSLNSNDQYLTATADYAGERLSLGLTGQYIRDTTRTSDIEESALFILQNRRREVARVQPSVGYKLSRIDEVRIVGDVSDTTYPSRDIRNFQQWGATGEWVRSLSERTAILANVSGFRVNSNDSGLQKTSNYAAQIGASHRFSERLAARLTAGPTLTDSDFTFASGSFRISDSSTTLGYGLDGRLDYRVDERSWLGAQVYRTVRPSGTTGIVSEETGVRLSATHALRQHLFGDASALYQLREDVSRSSGDRRRHYVAVHPSLRWQFAEDWNVRLVYRFRWQRYDDSGDDQDAYSNAVTASLTYRLPPLSMSR